MAAGDVTILNVEPIDRGNILLVSGNVQLDGSNPTPVPLHSYGSEVLLAVVTRRNAGSPPGVGAGGIPGYFSTWPVGSRFDLYAASPTAAGDATPIASTNNEETVNFIALIRR